MKLKIINIFFVLLLINSCVGTASTGVFGTGVSVALDPRSLGFCCFRSKIIRDTNR